VHARAYVLSIEEVIFGFEDGLDRLSLSYSLLVCILRRQLIIAIFISQRASVRVSVHLVLVGLGDLFL